jgi:glycogen phosphorylase
MQFYFEHPYTFDPDYSKPVAYYCMEYAIDQPLKIYAGGLGYLAGSHFRSAYELKQNLVGVGILWKYGYYDQTRKGDQTMDILFQEKVYAFIQPTNIKFTISVSGHDVWVTAYYLPPAVFKTAPLFLLSTDLPENDYLARTICHRLYDANPETMIAAGMLLGIGGCKLFDYLNWKPESYHLNESHGLSIAFYLHHLYGDVQEVRKRLVFTNHTAEEGGNPKSMFWQLDKMGFFSGIPLSEVKKFTANTGEELNYTLAALTLSAIANGVSRNHVEIIRHIWKEQQVCPILSITNGQNLKYWANHRMYEALQNNNDEEMARLKTEGKEELFRLVADQNGEIFDKNILTIVFAKRFTGYKRADLMLYNLQRFDALMKNAVYPVQLIWAGKPYPADYAAIGTFDKIVNVCKNYSNCSVLSNYELAQSKLLKNGADVWLNVPRIGHEACGTSGMSAAMNGAINVSIADGWVPEFAHDKQNSYVVPHANPMLNLHQQDEIDCNNLYDLLEKEIIPTFYNNKQAWMGIIKNSMRDIIPYFDSNRMASEYYSVMYKKSNKAEAPVIA